MIYKLLAICGYRDPNKIAQRNIARLSDDAIDCIARLANGKPWTGGYRVPKPPLFINWKAIWMVTKALLVPGALAYLLLPQGWPQHACFAAAAWFRCVRLYRNEFWWWRWQAKMKYAFHPAYSMNSEVKHLLDCLGLQNGELTFEICKQCAAMARYSTARKNASARIAENIKEEQRRREAIAWYEFENLRDTVQALYRARLYMLAEWLVQQRTGLPYQLIMGQWQLATGTPFRQILHKNPLPEKTEWRAADSFDSQDEQENDSLPAHSTTNPSYGWADENYAADAYPNDYCPPVNPANGMPMIQGTPIDVTGHVFGTAEF